MRAAFTGLDDPDVLRISPDTPCMYLILHSTVTGMYEQMSDCFWVGQENEVRRHHWFEKDFEEVFGCRPTIIWSTVGEAIGKYKREFSAMNPFESIRFHEAILAYRARWGKLAEPEGVTA